MLLDIRKFKKIGSRLIQRKDKNLNVMKWTHMGRLFLAEENFERNGSLYLFMNDQPIQSQ